MRRLEDRKRAKVLESACDKGSKSFWKAIKELTNENEPKQENSRIPKTILQRLHGGHRQEEKERF